MRKKEKGREEKKKRKKKNPNKTKLSAVPRFPEQAQEKDPLCSIPMQSGKQQTNPPSRRIKDRINDKVNTELLATKQREKPDHCCLETRNAGQILRFPPWVQTPWPALLSHGHW